MDRVTKISSLITEIFRTSLAQGSPDREFFARCLDGTNSLSPRELEQLEELVLNGILNLCSEWFATDFPSLSLMERCTCGEAGCNGWRLKEPEEEKESHEGTLRGLK